MSDAAAPPLAPLALRRILQGETLSRETMRQLFGDLMDGKVSDVLKSALLVTLALRGESADEIAGAAEAMRRRAIAVPHRRERVVDTCGTGGDGRGTFNISTAAAVVAAAAGAVVAKHGNRSVSSRSGSADLLAALAVRIDAPPEQSGRILDRLGLAFLFAPILHPAMREVMPVRRELGVRTLFNLLGPLTNPAGARRQVLGVYSLPLVETIGRVLLELGSEHALVVHGHDGLDEITTTGPTRIAEVRDGSLRVFDLRPEEVGLGLAAAGDLAGGTPEANAAIFLRLVAGEAGALQDVVALNAAAALYVAGEVESLAEGIEPARRVMTNGRAAETLRVLRELSRQDAP